MYCPFPDFPLSTLGPAQVPNLGVVVYQLKQCTNHFMTAYENRKQHLSKLEGLSELSVEDLKQVKLEIIDLYWI